VESIYRKNGQLISQQQLKKFQGNILFASENMVELRSTSRKDDLECLMYILCFLHTGKLPISEHMNEALDNIQLTDFIKEMLKNRVANQAKTREYVT